MTGNFKPRSTRTRIIGAGWIVICAGLMSGCQANMRDSSQLKPYEQSPFFGDNKSARELVPNTVARGELRTDDHFFTGKTGGQDDGATQEEAGTGQADGTGQNASGTQQGGSDETGGTEQTGGTATAEATAGAGGTAEAEATAQAGETAGPAGTAEAGATAQAVAGQGRAQLVDTFPYPVTREMMERGQNRYNVFCAPCHAITGYGDGMIVQRGFQQPPSFHSQRLRDAPVGHFFDVITNGFGTMYSYASRISPEDRWAIIAYIRALQLSQNATVDDVPADQRQSLEGAGQ